MYKITPLVIMISLIVAFPVYAKEKLAAPFIYKIINNDMFYSWLDGYGSIYDSSSVVPPENIDLLVTESSHAPEFDRTTQTLTLYLTVPEYTVNPSLIVMKMSTHEETGKIPVPISGSFFINGKQAVVRPSLKDDVDSHFYNTDGCYTLEIPVDILCLGKVSAYTSNNEDKIPIHQSTGSVTFDTDGSLDTTGDRETYQLVIKHVNRKPLMDIRGFIKFKDFSRPQTASYNSYLKVGIDKVLTAHLFYPRDDEYELVSVRCSDPAILSIKNQEFQKIDDTDFTEFSIYVEVLKPGDATLYFDMRANGKDYTISYPFKAANIIYPLPYTVDYEDYSDNFFHSIYGQVDLNDEPLIIPLSLADFSQENMELNISEDYFDNDNDGVMDFREIRIGDGVFYNESIYTDTPEQSSSSIHFTVHSSLLAKAPLNADGYHQLDGTVILDLDGDFNTTGDIYEKPLTIVGDFRSLDNLVKIGNYRWFDFWGLDLFTISPKTSPYDFFSADPDSFTLAPQTTKDIPVFMHETYYIQEKFSQPVVSNLKSSNPLVIEAVDMVSESDGLWRLSIKGINDGDANVSFDISVNGYTETISQEFTVNSDYVPEFFFRTFNKDIETGLTYHKDDALFSWDAEQASDIFDIGVMGDYFTSIIPTSITSSNTEVLDIIDGVCKINGTGKTTMTIEFVYNGNTYKIQSQASIIL